MGETCKRDGYVQDGFDQNDQNHTQFADIDEALSQLETLILNQNRDEAIADAFNGADISFRGFASIAADGYDMADLSSRMAKYYPIIAESMPLVESCLASLRISKTISQFLYAYDSQQLALVKSIADSFSLAQTVKGGVWYLAYDIIKLVETQAVQWKAKGGILVTEAVQLQDINIASKAITQLIADAFAGADTITGVAQKIAVIAELLMFREQWASKLKGYSTLAEALIGRDAVTAGKLLSLSIADTVTITDAVRKVLDFLAAELIKRPRSRAPGSPRDEGARPRRLYGWRNKHLAIGPQIRHPAGKVKELCTYRRLNAPELASGRVPYEGNLIRSSRSNLPCSPEVPWEVWVFKSP